MGNVAPTTPAGRTQQDVSRVSAGGANRAHPADLPDGTTLEPSTFIDGERMAWEVALKSITGYRRCKIITPSCWMAMKWWVAVWAAGQMQLRLCCRSAETMKAAVGFSEGLIWRRRKGSGGPRAKFLIATVKAMCKIWQESS